MKLVICVQLAYVSVCLTREMSVVREWTWLDVLLTSENGQESRRHIMPSDVLSWLMYKDRLFVTLNEGPYYLAYLDLTDNSTSPLLRPYPSYENQQTDDNILYDLERIDRCDRLWVLSVLSDHTKYMIVFDLKTDSILRNSSIPDLHLPYAMTVDDFDCDNEYVYISNYMEVWTYSWAEGDLWRHNITDNITSMALAPNSTVYYNVGFEPMVYYMSTKHLRDKSNKTVDIRELGRSRELELFLASSALDAKNDVLYYLTYYRTVIHAVPCWTSVRCSSNCQDVSIDPTHELRYITVDENGYLWAITRRSSFEYGEINYRLLSVPVKSTCVKSNANDTTNTSTYYVESDAKDTTDTTNINEITTAASSTTEQTSTLGSVPKHTTVNIADTTAGTSNSNITHAIGGTKYIMLYLLLFSFTNNTFNFNL